jgi:chromosome partitioning protein
MSSTKVSNPSDFEKIVLHELRIAGYDAELAKSNATGHDIVARKGGQVLAVQVKNFKSKVSVPYLKKFADWLEKPQEIVFTGGLYIAANGYSKPALTYCESSDTKIQGLGVCEIGALKWIDLEGPEGESVSQNDSRRYVGVFTCKGGVGKTTVAAHLAGAFALIGYDSVLVDLDKQGNLRKLLDEGVYLPSKGKNTTGHRVAVVDHDDWDELAYDEKLIVCDCNPELEANPKQLIEKFDYCIVPITLNPLGINKNADVIYRTFVNIRKINPTAELFVLVNNFYSKEERKNRILNNLLKHNLKKLLSADSKFHYIDPIEDHVSIRHSSQLMYWGYDSIVEFSDPQLAFKSFGGRSLPREDFLALAEFLEGCIELEVTRKAA